MITDVGLMGQPVHVPVKSGLERFLFCLFSEQDELKLFRTDYFKRVSGSD